VNFSEFESSLSQSVVPVDLTNALIALWYAGKGDWKTAHNYCQKEEGALDSDWVHAYLHRDENDLPNAKYWYSRADRVMPQCSLREEWVAMVTELLDGQR